MTEEKRPRGRPRKVVIVPPTPSRGRPKKLSIAEKEEKAVLDEQAAAAKALLPKEPRKGGRPKNENYLPFAEARDIVQAELLHSRGAFEAWHDREKPKAIPRFPYRVYTKEWVTWNDFLGTDNEFKKGPRQWREFNDATLFVHKLQLKTMRDWLDYCSEHAEEVPEDIPRRPDVVYGKWVSWNHWLGNKPVQAIEAKQEAAKSAGIFYIVHETDVPGNVFTYGVENTGMTAVKEWWERDKFNIVKMFNHEPDRANEVKAVVDALSTPYLGDDRQRITPNVWQIVEILQTLLCTIR